MTGLNHLRSSNEAASRRNLLLGGLVTAKLAPFPDITGTARAQDAAQINDDLLAFVKGSR